MGDGFAMGYALGDALAKGVTEWKAIQLDRSQRKEFDGAMALAAQRRGMIKSAAGIEEAQMLEQLKAQVQRSPDAQQTSRPTGNVGEDGTPETEQVIRTAEGDIPVNQVLQLRTRKQQADSQAELAEVDLIMELQARYPQNKYVKQWTASAYAGIQQKQQLRSKQLEAQRLQLDTLSAGLEREKFDQERLKYEQAPERAAAQTKVEADEGIRRDTARIQAEQGKEIAVAGAKGEAGPKETDIAGMRKEFSGLSGDFLKVRDAYARIQSVAKDSSAAGDLALIFSYIKVLDPGSTVREGEAASAENTRGVPDTIRQQYNKVLSGERLADGQRQDFLKQSGNLYKAQLGRQRQIESQFSDLATRRGMNPKDVVLDYAGPEEQQAAPPGGASPTPEGAAAELAKRRAAKGK